jgi:hypothetical protein
VRIKSFTVVTILMKFFWVKSSYGLFGRSQRFREACCLLLQDWSEPIKLTSTNQSTWLLNPKELHQNCHHRENLKSQIMNLYEEKTMHIIWQIKSICTKRAKLLCSFLTSLQPWRWRKHASPKCWLLSTNPHRNLTQKNIIKNIFKFLQTRSV